MVEQVKGSERRKKSPYDQIREAIVDGTFAPGSQLVESQIAEWVGVSRTPVREAFTRLEQDGVVERTDRGLVVRNRSPEEILDIYEVRITLEGAATRLAAERSRAWDNLRLERLLRLCDEADPTDGSILQECNRQFHHGIWLASHNEALTDLLTRLDLHLVRYPSTTLMYPGRWEESLTEHRAMVEAIVDRDPERARVLAEQHFARARDIRLALWEEELA
jgi:DNA-binding GntR family transcriptional regulator